MNNEFLSYFSIGLVFKDKKKNEKKLGQQIK